MKALVLLAFVCACSGAIPTWEQPGLGGAVRPEMGGPQPGTIAPAFEPLSSMRGSWVVVHFTASWCPYCDSEVAHLGDLAGPSVKVVLVDEKESEDVWRAYAEKHVPQNVSAVRDVDGKIALAYAPPRAQLSFADRSQVVLDSTLVIDPEGVIRLFLLPDSAHFDPTFKAVKRELDRFVAEDVVRVSLASAEGCGVVAKLDIAPGYHVQSHTPSEPQFIPTRATVTADDVEMGEPRYAAGATYAGATSVTVPCKRRGAAGAHHVAATIAFQACTATRCLFPTQRHIETTLSFSGETP
jgi:peroxiredoxin